MEVGAAEIAPAHEEELVAEGLARAFGAPGKAADLHDGSVCRHVHHFADRVASDDVLDTEFERLGLAQHEYFPAVVGQGEAYFGTGYGHASEFLHYVLEFHVVGLQELAARRGVVEKVAHGEVGADGSGDR